MIKQDFEAIIFDFGGVLIDINYQTTIDAFEALGITDFQTLYSQANQSNVFDAIETGQISPQHFINKLLQLLPKGITPNQVVHAWNAMLGAVPKERIALLETLRAKYPIYLLSNTNAIHLDFATKKWHENTDITYNELFNKAYFSHEIGMRKPHAEIFNFVCEEQGLTPKKTLFIDDSIQHIKGAESMGLQTYHLKPGETIHALFS